MNTSDPLLLAVSNMDDGSMSAGVDDHQRWKNRQRFLQKNGIRPEQSILVNLTYDGSDYIRYSTVSSCLAGDGITTRPTLIADGLFTTESNLALFLPVADCIGAVLFDETNRILGLSHLGRHNLVKKGGSETVRYMTRQYGTVASDLRVWISPSVGSQSYPLYDFDNRSLAEVAVEQLLAVGVSMNRIIIDTRDTAKDANLFSHSQYLQGNRSSDGRQAVVAMMRP